MCDFTPLPKETSHLAALDLEPLFRYIPLLERSIRPDGTYSVAEKVSQELYSLVYELGLIINFDWSAWAAGEHYLNVVRAVQTPDLSLDILCRVLTLIIRADRFGYLSLDEEMEQGTILHILRGMRQAR